MVYIVIVEIKVFLVMRRCSAADTFLYGRIWHVHLFINSK